MSAPKFLVLGVFARLSVCTAVLSWNYIVLELIRTVVADLYCIMRTPILTFLATRSACCSVLTASCYSSAPAPDICQHPPRARRRCRRRSSTGRLCQCNVAVVEASAEGEEEDEWECTDIGVVVQMVVAAAADAKVSN